MQPRIITLERTSEGTHPPKLFEAYDVAIQLENDPEFRVVLPAVEEYIRTKREKAAANNDAEGVKVATKRLLAILAFQETGHPADTPRTFDLTPKEAEAAASILAQHEEDLPPDMVGLRDTMAVEIWKNIGAAWGNLLAQQESVTTTV